jgi:hypothetical protein
LRVPAQLCCLRPFVVALSLPIVAGLAVFLVPLVPAEAQGAGDFDKITLEDLRPPISPAFVLLGVEPASVQHPTTPRALSTALLSLVSDKEGIPKNFAMEVTPFWLVSRPAFTFEDYYVSNRRRLTTMSQTLKRSSAFSLGMTPRILRRDTVGTSIALGYRGLLWPGRASALLQTVKQRYADSLGVCADLEPTSAIEACFQRLLKSPLRDSLRANLEPVGWKLQFAGGVSAGFQHDTVQRGHLERGGVWLTPSYRTTDGLELILVARYLRARVDETDEANESYLDGGMRLLWTPATAIALSVEAVSRRGRGGNAPDLSTSRYGALIEYRASSDMYLFYAVGKDFAAAEVKRNRLLSTIGLNFGFGTKPVIRVADSAR